MADLLFEIGTEEIPGGFMPSALEHLASLAKKSLEERHLPHGKIQATGTPRRLVLVVREVAQMQETVSREVMGPARRAAFDESGKPTKACLGFAKGQGVEVGSLQVKSTPKGDYVYALRQEGGLPAGEILSEVLPGIIQALPFPKSMRWGDLDVRFARPIRWILAILGGEVVPFEYAGLPSGNLSRGHRSMAPGSFSVAEPEGYFRRAKAASVVVDHQQRRQMIAESLAKEAKANGGAVLEDAALLDLVNFLVEFPVVTCGRFDEEFLKVPPEVLITAMKSHQKYFPVVDDAGKLLPLFLTVNNIKSEETDLIRKGNERVLSARLADARFFYQDDLREPLAAKAEKLKKVLYQEKLGTSYEKMERFRRVAQHLAAAYGLGEVETVGRAAFLCKADLVSEMVGEFPDLQGVMGKYYALESGETPDVAEAVYEHYLPRFAGDSLPKTPAGMAVSLADKMDTIAGSFGIGAKPTGSEDPYGLRRLAIGIVNIILEHNLEVDLADLVSRSVAELGGKINRPAQEVEAEMMEFFQGRLYGIFTQAGYRTDLVDAVLATGLEILPDARQRLMALASFCSSAEFEPLAVAFKRVGNIIPEGFAGRVDEKLLKEPVEKELYAVHKKKEKGIRQLRKERKYAEVLAELAAVRPAVDAFFDGVMVMVEDEALKKNRLALMAGLAGLFSSVADFTRVAT